MPTSKELVSNKPLAGSELAKIILSDAARMMENDGALTSSIAYRRVSYELRLIIHTDNPNAQFAHHKTGVVSRAAAVNDPDESHRSIENGPPPLSAPSPDSYVIDSERTRTIDSPNLARVEHRLPIEVVTRTQDGRSTSQEVVYPEEALARSGETPQVTDTDHAQATRAEWKVPSASPVLVDPVIPEED